MDKTEAVELLGGPQRLHNLTAERLGIGKGAFSQWPDELTREQSARVIGTAWLLGIRIPARFRDE